MYPFINDGYYNALLWLCFFSAILYSVLHHNSVANMIQFTSLHLFDIFNEMMM